VSVKLGGDPSVDDVVRVMREWKPEPQRLRLHSAPATPLLVHAAPDRPQPRRDVEFEGGMTVHVGRVRPCPILGIKFTALGHNTERGAAGGSILNAELALAKGLIR
jgi:aspartate-semialdehyde dehydrogenase